MTEDNADFPCYVGYCPCGCGRAVLAVVDAPDYKTETAETIANAILSGMVIERTTVGRVRTGPFGCATAREQP